MSLDNRRGNGGRGEWRKAWNPRRGASSGRVINKRARIDWGFRIILSDRSFCLDTVARCSYVIPPKTASTTLAFLGANSCHTEKAGHRVTIVAIIYDQEVIMNGETGLAL